MYRVYAGLVREHAYFKQLLLVGVGRGLGDGGQKDPVVAHYVL